MHMIFRKKACNKLITSQFQLYRPISFSGELSSARFPERELTGEIYHMQQTLHRVSSKKSNGTVVNLL